MAVTTYEGWVADGRPAHQCQPGSDLLATLKKHKYTVYWLGDDSHLKADPPEDHTPYSHTPWPGSQPYPAVLAIDIMPGGDLDWRDLGARIVADKNAGKPGTEPIKYINWTDRAGNCRQDSWKPTHVQKSSTDTGHIHISFRTDYVNSHVMAGYDPVLNLPPQPVATNRLATAINHDGRIEIFASDSNGVPFHNYQTPDTWSGWASLGGKVTGMATSINPDGRLEIFGTGADGFAYHNWQSTPGGGWAGWAGLNGQVTGIAAARNLDGRIELFGTGPGLVPFHNWQTPDTWSGWVGLDGQVTGITTASNADGRLEIFGTGSDGFVYHNYQTTPGGTWSGWAGLGAKATGLANARTTDGRLEIYGFGADGAVIHNWQTTSGGAWAGFVGMGKPA